MKAPPAAPSDSHFIADNFMDMTWEWKRFGFKWTIEGNYASLVIIALLVILIFMIVSKIRSRKRRSAD